MSEKTLLQRKGRRAQEEKPMEEPGEVRVGPLETPQQRSHRCHQMFCNGTWGRKSETGGSLPSANLRMTLPPETPTHPTQILVQSFIEHMVI